MATARQGTGREPLGGHHDQVFPTLEAFVAAGALVGVTIAAVTGELIGRNGNPLVQGALLAGLGAILGLFLGLSRAVWRSARNSHATESTSTSVPDRLWDPWVDSGREVERRQPEPEETGFDDDILPGRNHPATGVPPERARVRPRVISPITGEAIPLDDEIGPLIQEGRWRYVGLIGGPGSGKTTALRHLAAVLPPWALARIRLMDRPPDVTDVVTPALGDGTFVISAGPRLTPQPGQLVYSLASWSKDDVIEYLLSAHWDQCASVMARLKTADDRAFLKGIPELWTVVLDRMADDELIHDVRAALRTALAEQFNHDPGVREVAEDFCLTAVGLTGDTDLSVPPAALREREPVLGRLIRHRPAALLLATDRVKDLAERGHARSQFRRRFPHDLVQEAALAIAGNALALQHLSEWLRHGELNAVHPMAASLLHAAVPGWRPDADCRPRLSGAYLARAAWPGLNLANVNLELADLREANLAKANLEKSRAGKARLTRANLQDAVLNSWVARCADLSGANLRSVQAARANFHGANLAGASLIEANLWKARLEDANIEAADFTGANLEDAKLKGLKLHLARFDFARFGGADLRNCDLEEMVLTVPDFHDADLRGALLTASRMQEANFVGANLCGAGLADVDWPGADLHDADLRRASFHLGSSRSGLVGSPIACEGSRTGFYTDDYDEQDIKSPEEIRKANLRGADLGGARIEGVDFYLVDLRDAKYTRDQAEHFRNCRAILHNRID